MTARASSVTVPRTPSHLARRRIGSVLDPPTGPQTIGTSRSEVIPAGIQSFANVMWWATSKCSAPCSSRAKRPAPRCQRG